MLSWAVYAILAYHGDSNVVVQDVLNSVLHFCSVGDFIK